MKVFSVGEVANLLGVHRDKLQSMLRNISFPKPSMKIGNRNAYTMDDVWKTWRFLVDDGYPVTKPEFDAEETPACTQSGS